ncbi:hypothetical protein CRG98_030856 [Punica granatum]|uniref:Uncharacterized protein n=1 Tax=Punica granatum TaxID=22663 RepID=A0A2I0IXV0_PUNGR|nr:hypothetical protein CRG98_030856 [Punica granatum]
MDGMGRANETRTRTGCSFPSIDRGVSDFLAPRISVNYGMMIMPLDVKIAMFVYKLEIAPHEGESTHFEGREAALTSDKPRELTGLFLETRPCSGLVVRCSGIVVIFVLRGRAPKARRETFMTTETSFGKPSRVPEGHLKLVPRPWWSLGACRAVLGGRLLVSGAGPGSSCHSASSVVFGIPCPFVLLTTLFRLSQWTVLFSYGSGPRAHLFVSDCRVMNSVPGFGRESSCGKPVGQNGVLTLGAAKQRLGIGAVAMGLSRGLGLGLAEPWVPFD